MSVVSFTNIQYRPPQPGAGGEVTITLWEGPGGVVAFALDGTTGAAGMAVAPTASQATTLLEALVDG